MKRISAISVLLLALALPAFAAASPEPPPPGTPPSLTGLEMTERVILSPTTPKSTDSKLPRKTIFSFFLNQNATFSVVFKQIRKDGTLVRRGAFTRDGVTGKNRVRFEGKLPKPKGGVQFLTAGRYRAFFKASNEFGTSPEASIGFRVFRPKN
ncbi:MAG TPA: hypothetical protein VNC16_05980 [Solirubrobacterales bacterium]|nr:hypothetical protein [Solirubrobacterales bacterium]